MTDKTQIFAATDDILKFLENNTNAMFMLDSKFHFIYINKNAQKFTRRKVSTLIGKNILTEFPQFKKTSFYLHYKEALKTQKEVHFEEYYPPLDIWLSVNVYPSKDGLLIYYSDITDRKKIENELKFQKLILNHVSNCIVITDKEQCITYWNKGAESLFGYTSDEIVGRKIVILLESLKNTVEEEINALNAGQIIETEWNCIRKDGRCVWTKSRVSQFFNGKGEFTGYIYIASDITEQKNAQDNLLFLAHASKTLSSSLDFRQALQSVADLAVQMLCDWCAVDLYHDHENIELIAVSHREPKKTKWARKYRKETPPDMNATTGLAKVFKERAVEYYPLITDEFLKHSVKTVRERKIISYIGLRSLIIVPVSLHGTVVAAITFVSSSYKRLYTQDDVRMAEELAARASLAIENAHLYQRAENERERLNNLLSNVPGVVWESYGRPDEATQRINFVSEYVETMLGYTVQEWVSTPNFWLTIVHPEDRERASKEAAHIFAKGKAGISRFRWLSKKGKSIWVEAQSTVIKDDTGVPIGMRGVTMDITERVQLEQKKDEFIGIASHELKTPLTSVKGYLQILERKMGTSPDAKAKNLVAKSNVYIDRLSDLISDLLDVSKIQAGKLLFNLSSFDICDVINESIEAMASHTSSHKIVVEGICNQIVIGDKNRIEQVLTNLLTNAVKYSPQSDTVFIRAEKKNDFVIIAVRDSGIGVPRAHQKNLFQRFYRVEASSTQFTGLGIGLYISAQIIKRHGGEIWVESDEGKGSTFYFSLPVPKKRSVNGRGSKR